MTMSQKTRQLMVDFVNEYCKEYNSATDMGVSELANLFDALRERFPKQSDRDHQQAISAAGFDLFHIEGGPH